MAPVTVRRSLLTRSTALATLLSLLATSCGGRTRPPAVADSGPAGDRVLVQDKDAPPGLTLRLSDGAQGAPAIDRARLAPAAPLAAATVAALLGRARPLPAQPADAQPFALRDRSKPPPRTGATLTAAFPPPPSSLAPPAATDAGAPLEVLRYMPEGEVPLAPSLSVTFSQPMVAVTSQDDAAAVQPVRLTPQPPGRWRWIGTRTIVFDPTVRFPQATTYQVEIPAGTRAAGGATLPRATKFSFETPAPSLVARYPAEGSTQRLDVPVALVFDQKIDPLAMLDAIRVTAGGAPVPVRLLARAEIDQDRALAGFVDAVIKDQQDGRWLAFRPARPLPADARVEVTVAAGAPSAEGPGRTRAPQAHAFRTYPPLKIVQAQCGWGHCPPGAPLMIELNNALDEERFDPDAVTIAPALRDAKITASGGMVMIQGLTTPRTTYKVGLPASLTDVFGQQLGAAATRAFTVGDAEPSFFGPSGLVVLDPSATRRTFDVFSTSYRQLKVQLHKVTPADFEGYRTYLREAWNRDRPPRVPGTKVFDGTIPVGGGKNQLAETAIDLAPALGKGGLGHALVIVEPAPWTETWDPPRVIAWVQSTRLAVDAHVDDGELVAFATDLATGAAAGDVALELRPFGLTARTDARGLATFALAPTSPTGAHLLVARRGDDVALLPDDSAFWGERGSWTAQPRAPALAWYVVDDRKLYKPGETVSLKGWLRVIDPGEHGDVAGVAGSVSEVSYKVLDSQGDELLTGRAPVTVAGGFATTFALPKTPNLGYARVQLQARGARSGSYSHQLRIEEFRRPEFEVRAEASQGPLLVGGSADVTVKASYYAGGPLPGAQTTWDVTSTPTSYTPPNRDDFIFGSWEPWWGRRGWFDDDGEGGGGARQTWSHAGTTDATGAHTLRLDVLSLSPARPMSVIANATVTDVNRQAWTASSALIVHPATRYVGLRMARPFVEKGTPFALDVIGVDLDGKATPGASIEVSAVRVDWTYARGRYARVDKDRQACAVVAAATPARCELATPEGGMYEVTATITDDQGRPNRTTLTFWVSGGDRPPARQVEREEVQLIPDKQRYAPGDTAEVLVQAPFYPAEALVTWRRSGIVKVERLSLTGPTATVKVPIVDAHVPNLHVQVDLVGAAPRTDDRGVPDPKLPRRPAYAVGVIDLPVPPRTRALAVEVAPAAPKVAPGASTSLALVVKDAAGKPVAGAEAAVIVVDEAVLALTGYKHADPLAAFYGPRDAGARDHYARAYVTLARPSADALAQGGMARAEMAADSMAMPAPTPAVPPPAPPPPPGAPARNKGAAGGEGGASAPIAVRTNFDPLAAFSPAVTTDASGRATVSVTVPDNLTRYRVVAIAAAGERQFGKGESALTARLPLMIRPSPPRFLNFGDTFRLPVVVQNQTDAPMTVQVAVRATNARLTDGAGREVTVPANDRVEVQFPAAAELAGTARFQIVGASGAAADAAEVALPVWTPATTEAFATYGVIDDGALRQPVALPGQVVPTFGGLEITTSSTNVAALTDALLYLATYPFDCAEQRASRIIAIASLRDVLTAFAVKDLPAPAALEASVRTDLERLAQQQNDDGGFAFWRRGFPSQPYLSIHVASALAAARAKGFDVPAALVERALGYLRRIEQHTPAYYPKEARWALGAFALAARKELGDLDVGKARRLYAELGGAASKTASLETFGWLLAVLAQRPEAAAERRDIVRLAQNRVAETAGAAHFVTSYADGAHLLLASDRRVDGVMLDALMAEAPTSDLIPKLVTGLLGHRRAGRWGNTQENAFALRALDRYFELYEKVTPAFVARVWLGADFAGEHAFRGRTTDQVQLPIPMKEVAARDRQPLTIQKDGAGRLYYRIGMTYAPASLQLAPADRGFMVERRYEAVDAPGDVGRDASGTWRIKAGARVRVTVTMVNEARRYHVALVDPLPAGLEAMNPGLAVTGPIPEDPKAPQPGGRYGWWYRPWYEHQNLRDERTEAFTSLLWEGVHTYSYVARATTPGEFVVPPAKAEEMYMPETFGRSASDKVVVE